MEDIKAASGCPKGDINAQKDGIFTRGVLFDDAAAGESCAERMARAGNGGSCP